MGHVRELWTAAVNEAWRALGVGLATLPLTPKSSKEWPVMSEKQEPLPEADKWKDVEDERQHLVLAPRAA